MILELDSKLSLRENVSIFLSCREYLKYVCVYCLSQKGALSKPEDADLHPDAASTKLMTYIGTRTK